MQHASDWISKYIYKALKVIFKILNQNQSLIYITRVSVVSSTLFTLLTTPVVGGSMGGFIKISSNLPTFKHSKQLFFFANRSSSSCGNQRWTLHVK